MDYELKKIKQHSGVIVPMITPFTEDGKIDFGAVEKIIENFIKYGAYPFLAGTTGEAASISIEQKRGFVKFVCRKFSGRTKIYAGIGSNNVAESIENGNYFSDLGVSAVAAHLPCYYPLRPRHIKNYFETLADEINGSLIIYNITATTHISIPLDIIEELSYRENVVGVKDSERDENRLLESIKMWKDREDFSHLIGWGAKCFEGLAKGSDGLVPSTGNITPGIYVDMYDAVLNGDLQKAEELQIIADKVSEIYQKNKALSESLAALKIMMKSAGLGEDNVLPPLIKLSGGEIADVKNNMKTVFEKYDLYGKV